MNATMPPPEHPAVGRTGVGPQRADMTRPFERAAAGNSERVHALPDLVTRHPAVGHHTTARFVAQVVALVAIVLATVALLNWIVDPLGLFGHAGPAPLVQPDGRANKVALLKRGRTPDVVLLGSSRMLRYDPTIITTGTRLRGFNAAVAGSDLLDAAAFTSWLAERHRDGKGPMPHVVYGIGVEEFHDQPGGAALRRVPELARQVQQVQVPFGLVSPRTAIDLQQRWMPLLELSTLRQSLRSIGRELSGGATTVNPRFRSHFADDGLLLRGHDDATLVNGRAARREINTFRGQYVGYYERRTPGSGLPEDARAQLEHLLAVANAAGDSPTLFLLPMRAAFSEELGPIGRDQQTAEVRAYLHELRRDYRFTWHDRSVGPIPGDPARGWFDDVHPRLKTAAIVLRRLRAETGAASLRGDDTFASRR